MIQANNVMYFKKLNNIGGVESFVYYLAKKQNDFIFLYGEADEEQVLRLAKYIKVRKYKGEKVKCKKFFSNYYPFIINNVEAEEYIEMIHCDFDNVKLEPILHPKLTKYLGVSKYVCDVFERKTGIKTELCYNPIVLDIPKVKKSKELTLISATRVSSEKGAWRIDKLSEMLDKANVKYKWYVYTNKDINFSSPNVIVMKQKLDLTKEIAESTYLVQLSNCEAYCYSVVESLMLGTPVICTDLPVFKELGLDDTNSIKVDFNLQNVDIDKIVKGLPKFTYKPPKDNWDKYIGKTTDYNPEEIIKVRVLKRYTDIALGRKLMRYEITKKEEEMTQQRASYLEASGLVECC